MNRIVCPDGTYGVECAHNCSSNCKNPPCDKFTADGACPNGECDSGFKGNNCSEGTFYKIKPFFSLPLIINLL